MSDAPYKFAILTSHWRYGYFPLWELEYEISLKSWGATKYEVGQRVITNTTFFLPQTREEKEYYMFITDKEFDTL